MFFSELGLKRRGADLRLPVFDWLDDGCVDQCHLFQEKGEYSNGLF